MLFAQNLSLYYGCQNMFISIGNPLIFAVICDELKEDGKMCYMYVIHIA
ncbi:hypothetical protein [Sulfolobus spindle-shaped virus]|nr:hypothetical protein [Sulfolobus spindle-shaped virus]